MHHVFLGNWHSNVPCHILFLQSHTSSIIRFLYGSLILEPSTNNFAFWWSVHQGHHLLPLLTDFIQWLSRMQLRHINVHINNRSKGYFQICKNIVQFLFCFCTLVFRHYYVLCREETKQCRSAIIQLTFLCWFFSYYANAATNQDA